ncbi:hypothetical protein BTS2_0105 [Bacillus sp. TS-2]|nr:hypothetical protein BTS2_0105 [Bacillus sp. TS-2]
MNDSILFITGMSGTGKSTVLEKLSLMGFQTIDTDYFNYSISVYQKERDEHEWLWDEDKIERLLKESRKTPLIISGTVSNQGKFYGYFNEVICLTSSLETILYRVSKRTNNSYGKIERERDEITANYHQFNEIIKRSASMVIDTDMMNVEDTVNSIVRKLK